MGFSTILDILISIAIGGVLLLILWKLDDSATQNLINNGQEVVFQENLKIVASILEHDFRKIGYCSDYTKIPATAIIQADSSSITFLSDDKDIGTLNQIKYYLGPPSELASTPNPRDRFLYRVIDNVVPKEANMGVTGFSLVYYDALGQNISTPVANPSTIASVEINLTVEDSYAYDSKYSQAFWRQIRVASKNLHKR